MTSIHVSAKTEPVVPPYCLFTAENVAKLDAYVERHLRDPDCIVRLKSTSKAIEGVWPVSVYNRKKLLSAYIEMRKPRWKVSRANSHYIIESYAPGDVVPERQWYFEDWETVRNLAIEGRAITLKDLNGLTLRTPVGARHVMLACLLAYAGYQYQYSGHSNASHTYHTYSIIIEGSA